MQGLAHVIERFRGVGSKETAASAKGEGHLNGVQRVTSERSLTVERLLHGGRLRGIGTSVANHLRVAEDRGEQIP